VGCNRARISATIADRHGCASRRWAFIVAIVSSLTCACAALAGAPPDSEAYALAAGDRITVTIGGQPELSGEMTIDGSGNIVLPLIGPIRVEDLTVLSCQQLIHDRIADGFLKQPIVSVRISELRPLYVLGDVRAPGAYPFRYGNTAKSAVALAGGFGAAGPLRSSAISEFLSANERVRQLAFEHSALLIRRARLEAQREGSEMSTPAELPPGEEFTKLIVNEKATLGSRTALLKTQIGLLEDQKPRLQKETDAINAQIATGKSRLEFVRNEAKRSAQLVQQGLGVRTPEVQLRLAETNEETNIWRLAAQASRLQMDIGDLDIKIQEAKASFAKEALADLQKVRERLAEVNVTLPSARQFRDFKLHQAESAGEVEADRSFDIARARRGQVVVFQGTENTRLEPGDVVDVKKKAL